jgi:hypothetical protein
VPSWSFCSSTGCVRDRVCDLISGPEPRTGVRSWPDSGQPLFVVTAMATRRTTLQTVHFLSNCCGLRLGIMRLFGPFCRDFLVPWDEISVVRKDRFFAKVVQISFGRPAIGKLTVSADVADRLARAASSHWPEMELVPEETGVGAASRIIKQWILSTVLAAAFFVIAPRVILPKAATPPPILVCVLFPAIIFGFNAIVQYVRRQRP